MSTGMTTRLTAKLKYLSFMDVIVTALSILSGCDALGGKDSIAIGSKDFTESRLLAEMYAALLEDPGYSVERNFNLGGTAIVHQSLLNGDLDMYVEYTGTGLTVILGHEPMTD